MKKLLSLALALVLILGVTVVPASASTTDHPAGWEGLTPTNECTCGDNPIITDSSIFYDLGLSIDNEKFDNRMHTIVIQFHDIHQAYTPITIDLRTDEGRALYAEYEAKWQAMKNGQTAKTTTAPVATPAPTPTPTPTPVPTATPTPVATSAPVLASAAGSDFTIENGVLTKYNGSGGNVLIPGSVTSIGNYAFSSCDSLTSVTIPSSVTSIGHHAFWLCHSLTSVTIPGSVTSIGDDAFSGCSGLTKVTIENGVTSIGARAFHGCAILTSVTIPSSVTSIGLAAFSGCHGLKNVYYDGTTAQWKVIKIQNTNSKLTSATIHYNTTTSTSTPTPSAKQVNPDFDKTVFTDLGLEIAWASHEGLDENGIDTYYIFSGIQLVEYVTNAIGDKTYAKYELLRDTVVRKIGSNENSKSELTTSTETPPTPPTEPPVVTTPPPIEPPATPTSFPDVTPDAWYAEAVNAMTDAGIIKGDGNGNFRPDDTVTYGEFVTILARIANLSTEFPDSNEKAWETYNCYGRRLVVYSRDNMPHWAWPACDKLETALWNNTQMIVNPEDLNCDVVRGHALSVIYRTMKYVGLDTTPVNNYTEANIPDWNETVGVDNGWGNNAYYIDDQLHFLPDEFIRTEYRHESSGYVSSTRGGYDMADVKYSNPEMKPYVAANPYDVLAMYNLGVTEGVDAAHTCNPLGTLTRAELCVLLQRAGLDHVFTK